MTRGLLNSGVGVLFGLDFNLSCRQTYEENNHIPYLCRDISDVAVAQLIDQFPELADNNELLLVGCAPCQPFSPQRKSLVEHAARNLLDEFGRMVEGLLPAHILIENVPGIRKKGADVLQRFICLLEDLGYDYTTGIVNAKDYGVPQNRKRFILIASRFFVPEIPLPTHGEGLLPYSTVFDAIHNYPAIKAGQANNNILNHVASELSELNMERIRHTPHDGGDRRAWPQRLYLKCHSGEYQGHTDVYGRMSWNDVAPTLTSKCYSISNGRFGHPEQDRAISLREAAALQSFNDNYVFFGNKREIGKQIGNAVPVLLAQTLGEYILHMHNQIIIHNRAM